MKSIAKGLAEPVMCTGKELLPLVLGTAQLGMDYGVANRRGKPEPKEAVEIVQTAWENGIRFFDTAQAYGESERVLGRCLSGTGPLSGRASQDQHETGSRNMRLQTKTPLWRAWINPWRKLGVEKLWCLMLHRESLLDGAAGSFGHVAED